jgi:iron complex transport system permease protein
VESPAVAASLATTSGRLKPGLAGGFLISLLVLIAASSLTHGAVAVPTLRVVEILLTHGRAGGQDALVVLEVRLPRLLLGGLVGGALGMSGALMQGLFRNPLADPGLVGVSAGAGLAAAAAIVLGNRWSLGPIGAASYLLPVAAFIGALAATSTLYAIATRDGRTSVATMLLAGVALAALAGSLTGVLAYMSDDRQLRDLTFWSLGSLGGATWIKVSFLAPIALLLLGVAPSFSRGLNALALGETEAFHLGVSVQYLKIAIISLVSVGVGASVAAAGVISFVGVVAPHVMRLTVGPDHRWLLPLSVAAGAALVTGADLFARTMAAPAELPIGILTAAIGAPFFLWLLTRRHGRLSI